MSTRAAALAARPFAGRRGDLLLPLALLLPPAMVGALAVKVPYTGRLVVGVVLMSIFFIVALNAPQLALGSAVVWLTFLGFFRRALIPFVGYPQFDPLLLVGPLFAFMLWLTSRGKARPLRRTPLSILATLMLAMSVAQSFNPVAGVQAGLLGSLFYVGPLLWFFVGRTLREDQVERVFRIVGVVLIIPVAGHGLYHALGHFLPFELTWVGLSGGLGGAVFLPNFKIRPFSVLTNPQEYGYYLLFALTVLWAMILTLRGRRASKAVLFLFGAFALFLQGSRGFLFFLPLMIVVTLTLRQRARGARLFTVGLVGLMILLAFGGGGGASGPVEAPPPGASHFSTIIFHQTSGIKSPEQSTLPLHQEEIVAGFREAWDNPLGFGTGEATIAQAKVGRAARTTETDFGNAFVSLGLPGGMLFLSFIVAALVEAVRRARRRPALVPIATVGVLVAFLGQWWNGQMYAASTLIWLTLGALARPPEADDPKEPAEEVADAAA